MQYIMHKHYAPAECINTKEKHPMQYSSIDGIMHTIINIAD